MYIILWYITINVCTIWVIISITEFSYLLRIGFINTINKLFLMYTREWDRREHLGMDPIIYHFSWSGQHNMGKRVYRPWVLFFIQTYHPWNIATHTTSHVFLSKGCHTPSASIFVATCHWRNISLTLHTIFSLCTHRVLPLIL